MAVFPVYVNCQALRKDTGIPQYVLFVLSRQCLGFCEHAHMLPHCCPNQELRECMAAMILRDSCVSEALFRVRVQEMVSGWHHGL